MNKLFNKIAVMLALVSVIGVGCISASKVSSNKKDPPSGITDGGWPMVNPSLDDPSKSWCYFTHPVTCIGMPFMPSAVQVTPEGNIFTGSAEFCLFWGKEAKPMASRQRQFLDGYIPIVQDSWNDKEGLRYDWEAFGTTLDGFNESNTLQFIKLTIRNTGSKSVEAKIIAAIRHSAYKDGPLRESANEFIPSDYAIQNNQLIRNSQVVCDYPTPNHWEAVPGIPYTQPFKGSSMGIEARTEVGLAYYIRSLAPNETMELIFKLPRASVDTKDTKYLEAIKVAEYAKYRKAVVAFWTNALTRYSVVHTPGEPKIEQSHRAAAAHVMLGTRTLSAGRTQTDGLPYPDLFISAIYDYGQLYTNFGLDDFVILNFPHCLARQQSNGLFVDVAVSHGAKIHCAHGQTTSFISDYIVNTRNIELGKKMFPAIQKAVELIRDDHKTQPHGLMSPAIPYDNEMIKGQWTSHNYWALIGLRSAIRLAQLLNEKGVAADWLNLYNDYEKTLLKAVRESTAADGYVPTGLYGFITGSAARDGFAEYRTDQDWENEMLLWPTELLSPNDPLVVGTLKRLRDTKYREGIMTYRNGQHLHQYITTRAINQYTANGQPKEALTDMYSAILHAGSAAESFENMIRPWTDRDVEFCPPPHAWGCANLCNTIRNLFVMEQGGHGGLEPANRDLMLLNAVSPAWLVNGKALGIEKAPTSFGLVSVFMTPRLGGADITIKTDFHTQPHNLVIHIPYFVKLKSFSTDAKESKLDDEVIRLSSDATKLTLEWTMNPDADKDVFQNLLLSYRREVGHWEGKRSEMPKAPKGFLTKAEKMHPIEPLSFNLVLDAWKTEYARRFAEHVKAGGKVKSYYPVPLQPASERKVMVKSIGLLTNKPVTCSGSTPNHPANLANDGETDNGDSFWESIDKNAWWQVDIGEVKDISSVTVIPYYKDPNRYYQFIVKTSINGKIWTTFFDMSDNTKPIGKEGANYTGQLTPVRYIRVEMLGNSANEGKHLVEVIAK
jgi:hypothetical protein